MNKRTFLKVSSLAGAGIIATPLVSTLIGCSTPSPQEEGTSGQDPSGFTLPELGYGFDALEHAVDRKTMEIHYGKHHAGYVRKLNAALEGHALNGQPLESILAAVDMNDTALRNNGGGHFNHALFWKILTPNATVSMPETLGKRVEANFGSVENLLTQISAAAASQFGSGWAWLVQDAKQPERLFVTSTPNQDNPLMTGVVNTEQQGRPILGLDVWEHAYYLNYQNRRSDYVQALLQRINWSEVSALMR